LKYKIVFFGVKKSTISLLKRFKNDVDLIITINDKVKDECHISGDGDVYKYAKQNNIECYSVNDYTLKNCEDFFNDNEFDIGICYGWQRIIPESILRKFKYGVFGTHASPLGLPYGKGRSPLNWSIIRGFNQVFFNLFKYEPKADSGMIYSTVKFEINKWDTIKSIKIKDLIVTRNQVLKLINDYKNDNINLYPQRDDIEETFFLKRSPKDGKINLNSSCKEIYDLIRAVSKPFPGAFLMYGDSKLLVWEAVPFDNQLDFSDYKLGEIIEFIDGNFILKLVDGTLLVKNFECEKKLKKGIILK
jgi:methionyl-tRNA formyltransferase